MKRELDSFRSKGMTPWKYYEYLVDLDKRRDSLIDSANDMAVKIRTPSIKSVQRKLTFDDEIDSDCTNSEDDVKSSNAHKVIVMKYLKNKQNNSKPINFSCKFDEKYPKQCPVGTSLVLLYLGYKLYKQEGSLTDVC